MNRSDTALAEFEGVWLTCAPRVLLYARRQVGLDDAPDVVSETFAVAWRRWDQVPKPPLPWLIGTARNISKSTRRDFVRHDALVDTLARLEAVAAPDPAEVAGERAEALRRLAGLSERNREALLMISWDGLTPDQAAIAAGLRPGSFRVRLHRARQALSENNTPRIAALLKEPT
jgi:RNA polymerase sigma factor (sigma-70 family)